MGQVDKRSITLSPELAQAVDDVVAAGEYASASEVLRSALRALDREDVAFDEFLRAKVEAALKDSRPSVPAADVFRRLRSRHARGVKAGKRGA